MGTPRRSNGKTLTARRRRSREDLLSEIRRWARQIVERFTPERIILFGSHAYGRPGRDSDVDVLVVMSAANEVSQSIRLTLALEPSFPLDLIVRTPEHLRRGLKDGDSFLREIVAKGKLLYAQDDGEMGPEGRGRREGRRRASST